jgi:hypothetical protein
MVTLLRIHRTWKSPKISVGAACTTSCFDPGVIFIASFRLAIYYLSRGREIECNVSIQQSLSACDKVFRGGQYPDKINIIRSTLTSLREQNKKRRTPSFSDTVSYTRQDLMIIRDSMPNLSSRRPNELYGEVKASNAGNIARSRGKKWSLSNSCSSNDVARTDSSVTLSGSEENSRAKTSTPVVPEETAVPRSSSLDQWASALENGIANALGNDHIVIKFDADNEYS